MNSKSIAQFEEKNTVRSYFFAEPGDTIKIKPGSYDILGALSIVGKKNIVLKGSGINSTVLNFKNQVRWSSGLKYIQVPKYNLGGFFYKGCER